VLWQATSLSTAGVLICSMLVGLFGWLFLDLSWLEGWLLGAVISATDAAAVFSILESKKLRLREHISETLEMESGTNDPMAYFLTIVLTGLLTGSGKSWGWIAGHFALSISIGLCLGFGLGLFGLFVTRHLKLDIKGLYPLVLLCTALIGMGVVDYCEANLLLTMYIAGITIGSGHLPYRSYSINFFESISWLMEISLFIILGLQVFPHAMLPHLPMGIAVAFFLMLVARPVSVVLSLYPFGVSRRKNAFISWVGLRGATPIVFSLVPLAAHVRHSDLIFNTVFTIVILSVMVQGTTLGWLARQLNIMEDRAR